MGGQPLNRVPLCPRCRYDQVGEVERWIEMCPLEGCCPECGLRFAWVDILSDARPPAWWIGARHQRASRQIFGTVTRCAIPWMLWRRVRLEHDGGGFRLWLACAFTLALFYVVELATALACTLSTVTYRPGWKIREIFTADVFPSPFGRWGRFDSRWLLVFSCVVTLAVCVLPATRRRAKVAAEHIVRVAICSMIGGLLLNALAQVIASSLMIVGGLRMLGTPMLFPPPAEYRWGTLTANTGWWIAGFWICIGWLVACRLYLRLDRPIAVTLSLLTIGVLGTTLASIMSWLVSVYGWQSAFLSWPR